MQPYFAVAVLHLLDPEQGRGIGIVKPYALAYRYKKGGRYFIDVVERDQLINILPFVFKKIGPAQQDFAHGDLPVKQFNVHARHEFRHDGILEQVLEDGNMIYIVRYNGLHTFFFKWSAR